MRNISLLKMNRFLRQSAFTEGMSLQADCPKTARGWFIFRETTPPLLNPPGLGRKILCEKLQVTDPDHGYSSPGCLTARYLGNKD